ncbi:hypothetical protein H6B15_01280 [Gemmiger formicilis]|uniref:hypothetical protein n=1 Tax=Gemmiger formicilis TaxID=745368 RepID=UPI001959F3DF|nr:hypothetical protein [Gemmiger formicilis]MBM6715296.1 hypothetical protein [Gemmiger formicilis]
MKTFPDFSTPHFRPCGDSGRPDGEKITEKGKTLSGRAGEPGRPIRSKKKKSYILHPGAFCPKKGPPQGGQGRSIGKTALFEEKTRRKVLPLYKTLKKQGKDWAKST